MKKKLEVVTFFVDDEAPPYTTVMTPNVAKDTATNRRGSHRNLKSLTLIRYAKKALVFQIASNYVSENGLLLLVFEESHLLHRLF